MLGDIQSKYGSKSGLVKQLSVLMDENEQMRKLASFNKFQNVAGSGQQNANRGQLAMAKDFIENNKNRVRMTKEQR